MSARRCLVLSLLTATLFASSCARDEKSGQAVDLANVNPADYPARPGTIYGAWRDLDSFYSTSSSEEIYLYINRNRIAVRHQCTWNGESAIVAAVSEASATATLIHIDSANEQSTSLSDDGNPHVCRASLDAGYFDYLLSGDKLKLYMRDGVRSFERAN